jgi:hypothetical protein
MTTVPDVTPRRFSEVSAVTAGEQGRFDGVIDPGWTFGGLPNGGYLLAMLGRAATAAAARPNVLAASAHYLRPPQPGPVSVRAEVLRAGRTASQVRASLEQDGAACVAALLTLGDLTPGERPYWAADAPAPEGPAFEDTPPLPQAEFRPAIMDQVDLRMDPATMGFATRAPAGKGELRGWLALPHGEDFDSVSLLYALDSFPPATVDIAMSGWVPTLELTAYVRAVPAPGPVRVTQRAHLIQDGFVDEACYIWDSKDQLVAQATQLAGIRLG